VAGVTKGFLKTVNLYLSTTPLANNDVPRAPFLSSFDKVPLIIIFTKVIFIVIVLGEGGVANESGDT
jgi:hypothetical protein